jgi:hypothetical protein
MANLKQIGVQMAQGEGSLDKYIKSLQAYQQEGADFYQFRLARDGADDYYDMFLYKKLTPEEQKQLEIEQLENRLNKLKNQ